MFCFLQIIDRVSCRGGKIGALHDTLEACLGEENRMDPVEAAQWASAFAEYSDARLTNGNAIADMAIENFEEASFLKKYACGMLLNI